MPNQLPGTAPVPAGTPFAEVPRKPFEDVCVFLFALVLAVVYYTTVTLLKMVGRGRA